jgi:hypothetical protein
VSSGHFSQAVMSRRRSPSATFQVGHSTVNDRLLPRRALRPFDGRLLISDSSAGPRASCTADALSARARNRWTGVLRGSID